MAEKGTTRAFGPLATLLERRRHDVGPRPFRAEWLQEGPRLDLRVDTNMDMAIEHPLASKIFKPSRFLVAAALILVAVLPAVWWVLRPLPPASGPVGLTAVVLFKVGTVTAGGRELSVGDILPAGAVVNVPRQSLCDLQVRETQGEIVIRLSPETEFALSGYRREGTLYVRSNLPRGRAQLHVGRLPSREEVFVVAPTAVATVRGTRYEVSARGRETRVAVDEGAAAARVSLPEISELPVEIVQGSRVLRAVESVLREFEVVLGPGEFIIIRREISRAILAAAPAFAETLNNPALAAYRGIPRVDPTRSRSAAQFVDAVYPDQEKLNALLAVIRRVLGETRSRKGRGSEAELRSRLREYDQLIAVNRAALADSPRVQEAVRLRNQNRREGLMKEIERVMSKSAETLILKDGRRVRGVIITENGTYIVLTPEGRAIHAAEQVEGVDF